VEKIPFNRPAIVGKELEYAAQAIANGRISGDGPFTRKCHELLRELLAVPGVLLTTSCTSALEMAAMLLEVEPGDEVIVPSFTFVSTANAFVLRGANPIFSDIRPDTLNLDERQLESLITPRTKVIIPVHYGGVACEMNTICDLAKRRGIAVVEDNAHGLFGKYNGRFLGTFGCFATQSFHETKNLSCGEGGALLINDPVYQDRAEIIREKGTDRSKFFRGLVDKYTWVDLGSSHLPSDLLAAFLFAQLENREAIQERRRRIWHFYDEALAEWAEAIGARRPLVPPGCEQAYHLYYLLLPSEEQRDALIASLTKQGIGSVFHYLPLHASPMGRRFGGRLGQCPVTEDVSARLLRLPFYYDLTREQQTRVVDAVRATRL